MLLIKIKKHFTVLLICLCGLLGQSSLLAADLSRATVIEYVTFKAVDGINQKELADVASAVNTNLFNNYRGFIERTISLQDDGTWVEVVFWENMASAKEGLDKFLLDPLNAQFLSMVNPNSVVLTYSEVQ